jgi:transcriptional regulator with XRE-family HTH domain
MATPRDNEEMDTATAETPRGRKKRPPVTRGERLRYARKVRGMTQAELAAYAKISQASISRYEDDKDTPAGDSLQWILLGLEINWLWLDEGAGAMDSPLHGLPDEAIELMHEIYALPADERAPLLASIRRKLRSRKARK